MLRMLLLLPVIFFSTTVNAEIVVRFSFQQGPINGLPADGTVDSTVDLKLFDVETPLTVANFMSYVNDGSYSDSFIHRTEPGFVMQGGGFDFDLNNTDFNTSFLKIPANASVANEPSLSNLRGTIALAKVAAQFIEVGCISEGPGCTLREGTGPDSGTSEWFFNLSDNASLDSQNGGFTVFGEVINDGMLAVDSIATTPLFNLDGATFASIPLDNYVANDPIFTSNLVRLVQVKELFSISSDFIFETPTTATNGAAVFFINNTSTENLQIGEITKISTVETPFVITSNNCKTTPTGGTYILAPGDTCTFNVSFNPNEFTAYSDDINVAFPALGIDYKINVSGIGVDTGGVANPYLGVIYNITPDHNYGTVTPGSNLQPEFFIENISDADLIIGGMANIDLLDPQTSPFIIRAARCRNWVLLPGEKCKFVVVFRPEISGVFSDSFNIEFPELNFNHKLNLVGIGGVIVAEPDITATFATKGLRSADFGTLDLASVDPSFSLTVDVIYQNLGQFADLTITDIQLITSQPDEFSLVNLDVNAPGCRLGTEIKLLGYLQACAQAVKFTPLSTGAKKAILRIVSNDPDEGNFDFTVTATVLEKENDGVDKEIEDAGPNNGDANYDGIIDSEQSNVVTLPDLSGNYINYSADPGARYKNVKFTDRNNFPGIPDQLALTTGVFEFTVENVVINQRVKVGIILPPSINANAFYVYGPSENNSEPHWYKLLSDDEVAAIIVAGGALETSNGETVTGTFVTLYLKNGARGDSSFSIDKELKVIGAFSESKDTGTSSGRLNLMWLVFLLLTIMSFRSKRVTTLP